MAQQQTRKTVEMKIGPLGITEYQKRLGMFEKNLHKHPSSFFSTWWTNDDSTTNEKDSRKKNWIIRRHWALTKKNHDVWKNSLQASWFHFQHSMGKRWLYNQRERQSEEELDHQAQLSPLEYKQDVWKIFFTSIMISFPALDGQTMTQQQTRKTVGRRIGPLGITELNRSSTDVWENYCSSIVLVLLSSIDGQWLNDQREDQLEEGEVSH